MFQQSKAIYLPSLPPLEKRTIASNSSGAAVYAKRTGIRRAAPTSFRDVVPAPEAFEIVLPSQPQAGDIKYKILLYFN